MWATVFTWIYLAAAGVTLATEIIALVWQTRGGPASLTISEKIVALRSEIITIWMILPWLLTHLLFAPTVLWFPHHGSLGMLASVLVLVLSAVVSLTVDAAAKHTWVRLSAMVLGAALGYLTPIP